MQRIFNMDNDIKELFDLLPDWVNYLTLSGVEDVKDSSNISHKFFQKRIYPNYSDITRYIYFRPLTQEEKQQIMEN